MVCVFHVLARHDQLVDAEAENPQDRVVDIALTIREFSIHRNGSSQIGIVVCILGRDVHQDHLTVLAALIIAEIMEDKAVLSSSDDRLVGEATRSVPNELVEKLRLDLVFHHPGFQELEHAIKALCRDITGRLEEFDLRFGFYGPQLMHDGGKSAVSVIRIAILAPATESIVAGIVNRNTGAEVLVVVQEDVIELSREAAQAGFEFSCPLHIFHSRDFRRLVFVELVAFPDRDEFRRFANKEDLAHLGIRMIRTHDENCFFLIHPREIKQVRVLDEFH